MVNKATLELSAHSKHNILLTWELPNAWVVQPYTRRVRQYDADTTTKLLWRAIILQLQSAGMVCTNALIQ
jgi:hypothetical protein